MTFTQSDTIGELAKALVEFHKVVPKITKDKTAEVPMKSGGRYSYVYADLSTIFKVINDPLSKAGLSVVQFPDGGELATQLMHQSGEWIRASYPIRVPDGATPQTVGSAITYARRYALGAVLRLDIDDDDDGALASRPDPAPKTSPAPRRDEPLPEPEAGPSGDWSDGEEGDVEVLIKGKEEKTAKTGTQYAILKADNGMELKAFSSTMNDILVGRAYALTVKASHYNGKVSYNVQRINSEI